MPDAPPCVYCRTRPAAPEWRPFCSERCKMADLGRWLSGSYRVAGAPAETPPPGPDDAANEPDGSER